jgi:hypothetical protein
MGLLLYHGNEGPAWAYMTIHTYQTFHKEREDITERMHEVVMLAESTLERSFALF